MKSIGRFARVTNVLGALVVVFGVAAAAACGGSHSEEPAATGQFTGTQIVEGFLGVGPVAARLGYAGTVAERFAASRQALQNAPIPAEVITQTIKDMQAQADDPIKNAPALTPSHVPTPDEISQVVASTANAPLMTDAQYDKLVGYYIAEIDRQAPGFLDTLGVEMQSGDPGRVDHAMGQMKRTLQTVARSQGLAARIATDPALASTKTATLSPKSMGDDGTDGTAAPPTDPAPFTAVAQMQASASIMFVIDNAIAVMTVAQVDVAQAVDTIQAVVLPGPPVLGGTGIVVDPPPFLGSAQVIVAGQGTQSKKLALSNEMAVGAVTSRLAK